MRNARPVNSLTLAIWLLGTVCACGGSTDGGNDAAWTPCEGTGPSYWRKIPPMVGAELKHAAVAWTGQEVLVWGSGTGNPGFRYRPETGAFTPISATGAPSPRSSPYSAWTGRELIIWGGAVSLSERATLLVADGARYDPEDDRWLPMSTQHSLAPVGNAVAVWTGTEFIVWGGSGERPGYSNSGARYNPDLDRWVPISSAGAPSPRMQAAGVWTGSEFLVWGGNAFEEETRNDDVSTGGRYDPTTDSWRPTSLAGAPSGRVLHTLSWTGGEAIVWGGYAAGASGARYQPAMDSWRSVSEIGAPPLRAGHAAVSTGERVIILGGTLEGAVSDDGRAYNPTTDTWEPLPEVCNAPRTEHAGVWIDSGAFFWGGFEPPSWSTPTTGALLITPP